VTDAALTAAAADIIAQVRPRLRQMAERNERLFEKLASSELAKSDLTRWRDNSRQRVRRGKVPRLFSDGSIPPGDKERVWAHLEKARTVDAVDRAFGLAKAEAAIDPRRQAAREHYASLLAKALRARWNPLHLAQGWLSHHQGVVGKAQATSPDPGPAKAYLAGQAPSADELRVILRQLYADGYLVGGATAQEAVAALGREPAGGGLQAFITEIDWAAWVPGNPEAALQLADGGLQALLDAADVVIKGLTDTDLTRLSEILADGAAAGDSVDVLAEALLTMVDDEARAEMIASTELNRAVSASTLDTYQLNGVAGKSWALGPNPCQMCQDNSDDGVIALEDDFSSGDAFPPAHPYCECALLPHTASGAETTDQEEFAI
jgi:hypothetical protein